MNPTYSISTTAFTVKPADDENNKISFSERSLSVSELAECIRKGHAFCGVFYHKTDTLKIKNKKSENFMYSWYIGIDCDTMSVPMDEYLSALPIQPSIAYTTTSNGLEGMGYRYRLVYILNEPTHNKFEHRDKYYALLERLGINPKDMKDNCGSQCARMFFGSYNCSLRLSPTIIDTASLTATDTYDEEPLTTATTEVKPSHAAGRICDLLTGEFRDDWYKLPLNDILLKYAPQYALWKRSPDCEYDENGIYYYKPTDGFISIPRYKDADGKCKDLVKKGWRTSKSFIYATQIRLLNPDITFNGLCYALGELIAMKFQLDSQITNQWIATQAAASWAIPYNELKSSATSKFTTSKDYAETHRMSRQEVAQDERRRLKDKAVERYFNALKTDRENVKVLKEHGVSVSVKFIKAYRERHNLSKSDLQLERFKELIEMKCSMSEIMNELSIGRSTYFNLKKQSKK